MKQLIPYGRHKIVRSDVRRVKRVLKSNWLTQGPVVRDFEDAFADYTGAKFAIALSSGSAALHAAASYFFDRDHRDFFVPNITFVSTASATVHAGGSVHLVDIVRDTAHIQFRDIPKSADVVMPVDFGGLPTPIPFSDFSRSTRFIIDAAHSLGARTPRGPVGKPHESAITCFSLHPVKSITSAEGGMCTTDDSDVAGYLREFREHGIRRPNTEKGWGYRVVYPGFNYRLSDVHAAIGLSQLDRLDRYIEERNEIADRYRDLLKSLPVELPANPPAGFTHSYHLFYIQLQRRDAVLQLLRGAGVQVQVHYQPLDRCTDFLGSNKMSSLETSHHVANGILSLPIFPGLRAATQRRVVKELDKAITQAKTA